MQFDEKVVLVTGAGSGIGKAAAQAFAKAGARVAAFTHHRGEAEQTMHEITDMGGLALAIDGDVSAPDDILRALKQTEQTWGRLDVVFANAGINGVWAPLEEITPDEWDRTINTDLRGTFLTVKYALPLLKKQGGAIIITASVNGTRVFSNTGSTAYACAKAAQVAFTKMMALELAPSGVRVNVVCPGAITTDIQDNTEKRDTEKVQTPAEYPQGKIPLTHGEPGTAEEVADLVLFLASDAARHITGTEIWIDGAQSLLVG